LFQLPAGHTSSAIMTDLRWRYPYLGGSVTSRRLPGRPTRPALRLHSV